MEEMNTFQKIYEVVKEIPYGKVATYGQVAALAGNRRLARIVGYALHVNPNPETIPCYRVVTIKGEVSKAFAFGGENEQIELLEQEGVGFLANGTVDMKHYQWEKQVF
jgi:methylated-DNA-protein-cysteine methyltransferase-like protein